MSDLRLKCTKFDFRWGFQTPLGKLTVLLRLCSVCIQGGLLLRGETGEEGRTREREEVR